MGMWKKLRTLSDKEKKILCAIKGNGYLKVKCETHYVRVSAAAYIVNCRYLSEENCCFFTIDIAASEMSCYVISSF